jgi:hypothetical protein
MIFLEKDHAFTRRLNSASYSQMSHHQSRVVGDLRDLRDALGDAHRLPFRSHRLGLVIRRHAHHPMNTTSAQPDDAPQSWTIMTEYQSPVCMYVCRLVQFLCMVLSMLVLAAAMPQPALLLSHAEARAHPPAGRTARKACSTVVLGICSTVSAPRAVDAK